MAYDLGSYKQRLMLTPCVRARLAELDRVIASYRAGRPMRMHGLSHWPVSYSLRTSVWTGRTGDVEARMPLHTRLAYASIYRWPATRVTDAQVEAGLTRLASPWSRLMRRWRPLG